MKCKQILLVIAIGFTSAFAGTALYIKFFEKPLVSIVNENQSTPVLYSKFPYGNNGTAEPVDFTKEAGDAVSAVVHIKTKIPAKHNKGRDDDSDDFLSQLFGVPEQRASGSGVVISDDGYIVTNNHVITDEKGELAGEINVTLHNGKSYTAKVIGGSKTTDVAVLKINADHLPYMIFGNSDLLQTGQWVLAVGYPLFLETTVTAGIISATGRNVDISRRTKNGEASQRFFIQTDAAVNSGNSGGALINTSGELVGIVSAIMSPTGTYAGYSFAIPVNAVKDAVKEIIQSGGFQKEK
jgi:S1-C subfamily serine protease